LSDLPSLILADDLLLNHREAQVQLIFNLHHKTHIRSRNQGDNKMNPSNNNTRVPLVLAVGAIFVAFTVGMSAQVKTETSTTSGTPTHQVSVERGEVVYVSGNDLLVKMDDGSMRHFPNVPESARATVNGQQLGIHDLKPGMKLERTLTVKTTPQVVTTVKTVTGKVWQVMPPNTVILSLEDGTNEQFKIPKDQKFNIDGQETDAFGLKKGMKISATKIVEEPVSVVEHQQQVTGSMPPPPPAPPADAPILIAQATPPPAPAAPSAPAELPKTGSLVPLIGLLGTLCFISSLGLKVIRSTF
jgi:ribosomal protein L21E